jgi:hypothetical protein
LPAFALTQALAAVDDCNPVIANSSRADNRQAAFATAAFEAFGYTGSNAKRDVRVICLADPLFDAARHQPILSTKKADDGTVCP